VVRSSQVGQGEVWYGLQTAALELSGSSAALSGEQIRLARVG
jgi:hypothetical protein